MPPARSKRDDSPRRSLQFKPPSRVSVGKSSTTESRWANNDKAQSRRTSDMSDSFGRSANTTTIISSDNEDAEDDSMGEEEDEQSYLTTKVARRRSTIQSRAGPSTPRRRSTNKIIPPEDNPAAVLEDDPDAPTIPRNLLVRILHENFEDKNMKINKEAMTVMESYVKIFVKEAIARSKQETRAKADKAGGMSADDWLQVEDLEKISPQLMLDF